jgi:hypothetical protein
VVSCADKLHNLWTIAEEHALVGEEVWGRFKRGRVEQEWYYRGLVRSLCDVDDPSHGEIPFCPEFRELVEQVFGTVLAAFRRRQV